MSHAVAKSFNVCLRPNLEDSVQNQIISNSRRLILQYTNSILGRKENQKTYGHILKANLSLSPIRAKFCKLLASLSMILLQFFVTKLKL